MIKQNLMGYFMQQAKRYICPFIAISLFLFCNILGFLLDTDFNINFAFKLFISLFLGFVISPLLLLAYVLIKRKFFNKDIIAKDKKFTINMKTRCWKFFFISMFAIIFGWTIYLIAYFPGILDYDALCQIDCYNGQMYTQHPILHTLLVGFTIQNIGDIFNSQNNGILCYCLVQIVCCAALISYTVIFFIRAAINKVLLFVYIIFLALFAPFGVMAITVTKDLFFCCFFVDFFICVVYLIVCPYEKLTIDVKIMLPVSAIGMGLFRSNGIWILAIFIPLFLLFYPHMSKKIINQFISIVAITFLALFGLRICTNAIQGSIWEPLSVPLQQLSYSYLEHQDDFDFEDKEFMNEMFPDPNVYASNIVDPIKRRIKIRITIPNLINFGLTSIKYGLRYPFEYIEAFARLTKGYYYIFARDFATVYGSGSEANKGYFVLKNNPSSVIPSFNGVMNHLFADNLYQNSVILILIFNFGIWVWAFIFSLTYLIHKKNKLLFAFLLPLIWLTSLLLGPCSIVRYAFPLFIISPISVFIVRRC